MMKITIYVRHNHLDSLYKFLRGESSNVGIEWYQYPPSITNYFMVTIDYNDFVKLDDK
jgi:hypothetical protein